MSKWVSEWVLVSNLRHLSLYTLDKRRRMVIKDQGRVMSSCHLVIMSSSFTLFSFQSSVIMIIFSHHPSHHIRFSSTIMEQYLTVSKLFWLSSLSSSFGWVWGRDHHQIIIIISIVIITIIHPDYYHHNCYHNQLSSFIMIIINIITIIINIRAWLGGFLGGALSWESVGRVLGWSSSLSWLS